MKFLDACLHRRRIRKISEHILSSEPPLPVEYSLRIPSLYGDETLWDEIGRLRTHFGHSLSEKRLLQQLVVSQEEIREVEFDITYLDCICVNDSSWRSLTDFAFRGMQLAYDGPRQIRFTTDADFDHNTRWFLNRECSSISVLWTEWDGRFRLLNGGTGHHVAAIFRQCLVQERTFRFPATLVRSYLCPDIKEQLRAKKVLFCRTKTARQLFEWLYKVDPANPLQSYEVSPTCNCGVDTEIVEISRQHCLYDVCMQWLNSVSNGCIDISAMISACLPQPINERAFIPKRPELSPRILDAG